MALDVVPIIHHSADANVIQVKSVRPFCRRCTVDDSCVRGAREVNDYGDATER